MFLSSLGQIWIEICNIFLWIENHPHWWLNYTKAFFPAKPGSNPSRLALTRIKVLFPPEPGYIPPDLTQFDWLGFNAPVSPPDICTNINSLKRHWKCPESQTYIISTKLAEPVLRGVFFPSQKSWQDFHANPVRSVHLWLFRRTRIRADLTHPTPSQSPLSLTPT